MKRTNQETVEAVLRLHERLVGKQRQNEEISLPDYTWANVAHLQRRIAKARLRGWHGAANQLNEDLIFTLGDCRRRLEAILERHESASRPEGIKVSAAEVYRDLVALKSEFSDVEIDPQGESLSVTTDSIVLEGIFFGPFEIRLQCDELGRSAQPYRVIALDPHPAAKSDEITHPHVQDEHLCEGEGRSAIAAALSEGRLFDFFLLVSQVLHTYGRGSAYVELEHWDGNPCDDCGGYVDPEDRYYCHRCDAVLCDGCSHLCRGCDESFCNNCLGTCSVCENQYCSSCLENCRACRKPVCNDCLEDGLCRACHAQQHEEQEHDSSENRQQEPAPASE